MKKKKKSNPRKLIENINWSLILRCFCTIQLHNFISRFFFFNRWFIVERIEEDWMFYVWCSENLAAADAGAVVLGRARLVIHFGT